MGLKSASTVVSALSARSVVGLKSANTVAYALSARSAVGLKSASTVVGATDVKTVVTAREILAAFALLGVGSPSTRYLVSFR